MSARTDELSEQRRRDLTYERLFDDAPVRVIAQATPLPGVPEALQAAAGVQAPPDAAVPGGTTGDPSAMALRAAAATAALELFGFNPHQLRGPDGKWIKMPTALRKERRRERDRKRRADKKLGRESRTARDGYNSEILSRAGALTNALRAMGKPDRELLRGVEKLTVAVGEGDSSGADASADRARQLMERHGALAGQLPAVPQQAGQADDGAPAQATPEPLSRRQPQQAEPDRAEREHRVQRDAYNHKLIELAIDQQNDNDFDGAPDEDLQAKIDALREDLGRGDGPAADAAADSLRKWLEDEYESEDLPPVPVKQEPAPSVELDEEALQRELADQLDDYHAEILASGRAWVDMLRDPEVMADPDSGLDHVDERFVNELGSHVLALKKAILRNEPDAARLYADEIRRMLVSKKLQADHDFPPKPTLEELRNEKRAQAGVFRPPVKTSGLLSSDAPLDARQAALQTAVDAGVWGDEPIGQGAMGDTRKVVFNDGTRAIYKRAKAPWNMGGGEDWSPIDQTNAEEMASLVGAALGLRAPAVQRISDDEIHMEMVEGAVPAMNRFFDRDAPDYTKVPDDIMATDDALLMGLFDTLIDNPDRHGFNWMVSEDNRLYPIDHGLAFMNSQGTGRTIAGRSPFAREYFVNPDGSYRENALSRRDIAYVRQRLAPLAAEFERIGRPSWHHVVMERLKRLELKAKGGSAHQLPVPEEEWP